MGHWRTFRSRIIYSRTFRFCQGGSETGGALYIFVVNVNVNSDGLNVNVNRLENDNVWNGEYRHRVVSPQLKSFSFAQSKEFYYPNLFSSRPACGRFHLIVQIKLYI